MTVVFIVVAVIGLLLVAIGALLYLFQKPVQPISTLLMVLGALVFAIGEEVLLIDLLI